MFGFHKILNIEIALCFDVYIISVKKPCNDKVDKKYWQCNDGQCINTKYVCGGKTNCNDGSDEEFCTSCK